MGMTVTCRDCGEMFGVDDQWLRDHGLPATHSDIEGSCEVAMVSRSDNPIGDALAQLGEAVLLAAQQHADRLADEIAYMNARAELMDTINAWVATRSEAAGNKLAEAAHLFISLSLTQKDPRL